MATHQTFEQLAQELNTLLDKARSAAASGDGLVMAEVHAALAAFIERSDDRVPGAIALDDVAAGAMRDLTLARLDQSLGRALALRGAEVARIARIFGDAART